MRTTAYISRKIEILDCDRSSQIYKDLMARLTFDNPDYYKKLSLGKWVGNTAKEICLAEFHGNSMFVPFGMAPYLIENKDKYNLKFIWDTPLKKEDIDYGSCIKPFDYQEKAIETAIRKRQGIIVAPCGAGKTQIGLEIAARIGKRTLWLTHTHDLLMQSMKRAKSCFENLEDADFGTITAGKVDMGRVITFATVQTMSRLADLSDYSRDFDVIIVDEAHHVCGGPTKVMMFYKVLSSLSALYKYGLTATPKRSDGFSGCMFATIGPIAYEIKQADVGARSCPVKVEFVKTSYNPDIAKITMPDGTISFPKFYNNICADEERNRQLIPKIAECSEKGSVLVLTDRVSHVDYFVDSLFKAGIMSVGIVGKTDKQSRDSIIDSLRKKNINVMISTIQLAKEGLDVPSLDYLVFATPQKNENTITQSAGRVSRCADGKRFGTIIDFEDDFFILKKWTKKRKAIYKKLGFEVLDDAANSSI